MPARKQNTSPGTGKVQKSSIEDLGADLGSKGKEIEFTCTIFFEHNNKEKSGVLCIRLETVKLFAMMSYELTVEMEQKEKQIDINILGIATKHTYLTEVEPAIANIFCNEISGRYTLNVIKQDGCKNSAVIESDLLKRKIKIIEEVTPEVNGSYKFCNFHVTPE